MKKYLGVLMLVLSVCFTACDKDDDQNGVSSIPGCTDETAFNYDANASEDDGSCIAVIEGCTNESAYNYDANANTDDGSCDYSIASQFDGEWRISLLEYEASIDLSPITDMIDDITIQIALALAGNQITLEGEAVDAGAYILNYSDYTYQGILAFSTEEETVLGVLPIPSVPIDLETQGGWVLQDDDNELVFTDSMTGLEQVYEVVSLSENTAYLKGVLYMSLDAFDFPSEASAILDLLGSDFELPINMDLQLERIN